MGEFTNSDVQADKIQQDLGVDEPKTSTAAPDDGSQKTDAPDSKFATDVEGLYADGTRGELPVFDVDADEFFKNMKQDRRRMRFKSGSKAQQYHSNTKYRRPFWVRNKDDGYLYKIK